MTWEEFNNVMPLLEIHNTDRIQTTIECPRCGKELYKRTDIILPSFPVKYQYECDCGYVNYSCFSWPNDLRGMLGGKE